MSADYGTPRHGSRWIFGFPRVFGQGVYVRCKLLMGADLAGALVSAEVAVVAEDLEARRILVLLEPFVEFLRTFVFSALFRTIVVYMVYGQESFFGLSAACAPVAPVGHDGLVSELFGISSSYFVAVSAAYVAASVFVFERQVLRA